MRPPFLIRYAVRTTLLLLLAETAWSRTLTVADWNLEWFPGRSPTPTAEEQQEQMEAAQKVLKQLNPDIFLAEEVGGLAIIRKTGFGCAETPSPYRISLPTGSSIGRQQEAIASDLPANSTWSEEWRRGNANPLRVLAFAALTLPNGKLPFVYATHLKSNITSANATGQDNRAKREDSANQLVSHVADMQKAYKNYQVFGAIIGGDFNTNVDNPEWKNEKTIPILEDAGLWNTWTGVASADRLTWKSDGRFASATFDYILTGGLGKPTATLWKASEDASDHGPVVLKIEIP